MNDIDDYLNAFRKLHVDKVPNRWSKITTYRAPHKPILLMAIIDLFSQGVIKNNFIEINSDLIENFNLYWSKIMPFHNRSNIALPFFHLKYEKFWHLIARPGKDDILKNIKQIRSTNRLIEIVIGAKLDYKLYVLFCDTQYQNLLRTVLIENYFSSEVKSVLLNQSKINIESFFYSKKLLEESLKRREVDSELETDETPIRNQGFRRAITSIYDHRCAFCGIRMITTNGHSAIDAAHIIPWSISHNDSINNGMALCRLCHWTFDEGLMGVSQRYELMTSPQLVSNQNVPGHLLTLNGREIIKPLKKEYWPEISSLGWHYKKVFYNR